MSSTRKKALLLAILWHLFLVSIGVFVDWGPFYAQMLVWACLGVIAAFVIPIGALITGEWPWDHFKS